jgi:hypothetical protein
MTTQSKKDIRQFTSETYCLTFLADRPFVSLDSPRGDRLAELFFLSSIHSLRGRDDTTRIGEWEMDEQPGVTTFLLRVESSFWRAKRYRFRCFPRRFTYDVEVEGEGQLAEVNYFGGHYSGQPRWGSGFFWSGQHFLSGFNPEPNKDEVNYFSPQANTHIDMMGVPLPGRGDWFFTPPPFCFAMQLPRGWLSLGVETRPGQNRFTEYAYHGKQSSFHLSFAYDGQTAVEGSYQLPAIGFDFAEDEYTALGKHVEALSVLQPASVQASRDVQRTPKWWHTPIFCGWGAQFHLASSQGGRAPDYARQDRYEHFLQALDAADVNPGIVVLDDKWQSTYGENCADESKWPDLSGFIARQHDLGRKVLLWLKAWDTEGLSADECITNAAGLPIACDPSNPSYERRLRASVQRMISSHGYDADGFKIDFTARIPAGPGLNIHGDTWGLELMHLYLSILHSAAKRLKPDALIMAHTPHPYLADVVDMIRLNDLNPDKEINPAMIHRAQVVSIACPKIIIDTDNWQMPDKAAWRAYTGLQPELGVPSLYYATHVDATGEPLETEDYRLIREVWARYGDGANLRMSDQIEGPREEDMPGFSIQSPLLPAEG